MSSKSSDSDRPSVSDDDSEFNYIPGNYSLIESEIMEASDSENGEGDKDQHVLMLNHIQANLWRTKNG